MQSKQGSCELCGEPMPPGEEMFRYHGYSGPCPKPPIPKLEKRAREEADITYDKYSLVPSFKDSVVNAYVKGALWGHAQGAKDERERILKMLRDEEFVPCGCADLIEARLAERESGGAKDDKA
jgi:hypothetical protein